MTIAAAAAAAFAVSLAVVLLVERHARALGLIDLPNERSSHVAPRPRGGGLGIVAGAGAGLLLVVLSGVQIAPVAWVLAAAGLVAAIGLWDDVSSLGAGTRLLAQTAAACVVVWAAGGIDHLPLPAPLDVLLGWVGFPLAIVWMVAVTNFFNFMDGADGLAGGQACLTFAALAWVLWPAPEAMVALLVVAATVGFLVRNWSPARIFLGDVGSGWLGFLLAALPFATPMPRRDDLVFVVAVSMTLFLADPVLTLIRRLTRGAKVTSAHREHAYQRLIEPGRSHAPAVLRLLAAAAALSVLAAVSYENERLMWVTLACGALAAAIEWKVAARTPR